MSSNLEIVYGRLMGDAQLVGVLTVNGYTGLLSGGVWTRKLKREPPGDTPTAFHATAKGRLIRPSAVLVDRGDVPHRQRPAIPGAYVETINLYLYAPATQSGKTTMRLARQRIYDVLHDWHFMTEADTRAFVSYVDRVGRLDSEEFTDAVVDSLRFQIVSRFNNAT